MIGLFVRRERNEIARACFEAMERGLRRVGEDYFVEYEDSYRPCEVAIVFGIRKKIVPSSVVRQIIYDAQRAAGRGVLTLERGFIRREVYHSAGWNGMNGWADHCNREMPADRFEALGVPILPWRRDGECVVVCGQVPWDANVQHVDYRAWCVETIGRLRQLTGRPIVFRPHPVQPEAIEPIAGVEWSLRPLEEDLARAWAVVVFNSNTAVEAALAGVPVFVADRGSMAWQVANHDLRRIDNPRCPERRQWAADLAYAQWNCEEMAEGLTWRHLTRDVVPEKGG